jgi:hypothetical protein
VTDAVAPGGAETVEALRHENLLDVWQIYKVDELIGRLTASDFTGKCAALVDGATSIVLSDGGDFYRSALALEDACVVLEVGATMGALDIPEGKFASDLAPFLLLRWMLERTRSAHTLEHLNLSFESIGKDLGPRAYGYDWFSEFLNLDRIGQELRAWIRDFDSDDETTNQQLLSRIADKDFVLEAIALPPEEMTVAAGTVLKIEMLLEFVHRLRPLLDSAPHDVHRYVLQFYRRIFESEGAMRLLSAAYRTVVGSDTPRSEALEFHAAFSTFWVLKSELTEPGSQQEPATDATFSAPELAELWNESEAEASAESPAAEAFDEHEQEG